MARKLITAPPDGINYGALTTDKQGLYGVPPVTQRTTPTQSPPLATSMGQMITYCANGAAALVATSANTANLSSNITCTGLLTTDMILSVSPTSANAGVAYTAPWPIAANNVQVTILNVSNGTVTPTANQQLVVNTVRGLNMVTANLQFANIAANTMTEQIFTIAPGTNATATATINNSGQLASIAIGNQGSGYYTAPTVVITPSAPVTDDPIAAGGTGTATGLPGPGTGTYYDPIYGGLPNATGGSGATAIARVSGGYVVEVRITNQGQGYTAAPTISFIGGNDISPGMAVAVNPTANLAASANITFCNCRVVTNNQIGIQYIASNAAIAGNTANWSGNFNIFTCHSIPATSPVVKVQANMGANSWAATSANQTATSNAIALVGLTTTDVMLSAAPTAAVLANGVMLPGITAANAANVVTMGAGNTTYTAATSTPYAFSFFRPLLPQPLTVYQIPLSPGSNAVTAFSTTEIVYSLPSNLTIQANTAALVNKPSFTANLTCQTGARANASNQIAITYINNSNANITPPAETYTIAVANTLLPTIAANLINEGYCSVPVSIWFNQAHNYLIESQQSLVNFGVIRGA